MQSGENNSVDSFCYCWIRDKKWVEKVLWSSKFWRSCMGCFT